MPYIVRALFFEGTKMGVVSNDTYNFSDVKLVSTNGKFYFQVTKKKHLVYEVSYTDFVNMLVSANTAKNNGFAFKNISNSLDYLLDQLEMTEDLFTALLYTNWINE